MLGLLCDGGFPGRSTEQAANSNTAVANNQVEKLPANLISKYG